MDGAGLVMLMLAGDATRLRRARPCDRRVESVRPGFWPAWTGTRKAEASSSQFSGERVECCKERRPMSSRKKFGK